ncbi:MAG: TonB family protein [Proteobacteria bacterium]|nr:TonB family protein [Pseudomonadota bacterium]
MDHVASVPSATSGRMSPEAVGLAVLLHVAAGLALWWLAEHAPTITPREDPIEVTIERPRPPEPPPPPPPQAQPKPMPPPPPVEGLKPPAEIEADKATSVRPSGEAPKDIAAPPQRSLEEMTPKPSDAPKPPAETAMAAPSPPLPAPPPVEKPPTVARPQPQPQRAPPPPSVAPHQQPNPSPLVSPRPQSQPPAVARHQDTPTPPSSPFVNPAAEHARATAEQNYLWQVVSRLRGYRYHADVPVREGLTVVMVTIARDGRLLDAQVVRSSGVPAMDQGVLAGIRQGAPYAPLPASLSGPSARFRLPLVSVPDRR